MANMSKKWVVLCSTAITAVYAAGFFTTESQASIEPLPQTQVQLDTSQSNRMYNDGVFTGMGSNRRGSIQVKVTIKEDRITDVEISDFEMHYAESDVVDLPNEVVQTQNPQVDNVSGATYSTAAFEDAVQDALAQAMNA
ncbi:FMN-binding protein [Paenibacillus sp. MWE-103]|uniref:FMN-binding protein n=2 Tax=Paenibacillus artemisiicola TaxID=1172618 RepID=A0ABS3W642_9BACL|nr:FMN-binding protein [Paenibacillus artemisiicola]